MGLIWARGAHNGVSIPEAEPLWRLADWGRKYPAHHYAQQFLQEIGAVDPEIPDTLDRLYGNSGGALPIDRLALTSGTVANTHTGRTAGLSEDYASMPDDRPSTDDIARHIKILCVRGGLTNLRLIDRMLQADIYGPGEQDRIREATHPYRYGAQIIGLLNKVRFGVVLDNMIPGEAGHASMHLGDRSDYPIWYGYQNDALNEVIGVLSERDPAKATQIHGILSTYAIRVPAAFSSFDKKQHYTLEGKSGYQKFDAVVRQRVPWLPAK